ncbi:SNF2 domain-containing protein / helicase domain-containing protein [Striga hermonthica]|uniref:SNF2 domain-containing protein / helicase domain-containing protein n=1 Tax=Striga hermonthica TaxID=68872 RepID=A0A9N7MKD0_STRHE|nr:SNF2 domain-containing protein / helicase domain-containing protein [Striga hermonthica]
MIELDTGKYGSVTKEILKLVERRRQLMDRIYSENSELWSSCPDLHPTVPKTSEVVTCDVIDLDDDQDDDRLAITRFVPTEEQSSLANPVVLIESDDENDGRSENFRSSYQELNLKPTGIGNTLMGDFAESKLTKLSLYEELKLEKPPGSLLMKDFVLSSYQELNTKKASVNRILKDSVERNSGRSKSSQGADQQVAEQTESKRDKGEYVEQTESTRDKGEYVGTDEEDSEDPSDTNSDGLGEIWNDMTFALECSKTADEDRLDEYNAEDEEECEHSFILKDDIGDVCRICGVIKRGIESIIEFNFSKAPKSTRTYRYEGRASRDIDPSNTLPDGVKSSEIDFTASEIHPHPRHRKEMKPHQLEGFNFLVSNLVTENPGGCILAHAPGSGKTFMIISFLQSFMAKYPAARPLVVLPKGIVSTWKKEFARWQVEDIPLYDCYSAKADNRAQQLEVLKEWVKERSILFLGYQQFSKIVNDSDKGAVATACRSYLLTIPTILILDEGHTPRNQETDVLAGLERVETPRKVVLSGTLYQNHVKEVFNILNLVRPKFLKMEIPKAMRRRILGRAEINNRRNIMKNDRDDDLYELIEHTLIKDENSTRKAIVIQDLREMTRKVLHYFRGDSLDELPGLVDFSVYLKLSPAQKFEAKELMRTLSRRFSITSRGSAVYVHPKLKELAKNSELRDRVDEGKIDEILVNINLREGVKLDFYLNLLQLCESSGEKILVFSQYRLPLKFLEMVTAKVKGYSLGKEMFAITGDSHCDSRESSVESFNESPEARVLFGSIKACGEGISLVGASRIIILDVHLNPSVTRQAIGRAFRPGQVRKVYTYRLIAEGSPEEEDHETCFRKELIPKMWFEWDESRGNQKFDMETVDVNDCGDMFLETARLKENVVALKRRW